MHTAFSAHQQLVTEVDVDKDGSISYEEFRRMWGAHTEPVAA
jgi:Ca2+-binding EF-hand superfamily protein